jgi:UDP-glucose 4-epimerase
MAAYLGEALGIVPKIRYKPPRVGEVTHYVANIGKARALLGFNPQTPLREGIHKAVAWAESWIPPQPSATFLDSGRKE